MILIFLSLSRHMSGSLFGNPFHELLACRLTAFNFLNNIVASFWNIMMKRLMERAKTDYCHWITQGAWMYCTLEGKWETSSWTEGSLNILMNSFVIRKLDFNLFGDLLFCCFHGKQWRKWQRTEQRPWHFRFFSRLVQKIDTEMDRNHSSKLPIAEFPAVQFQH